MKFRDLAVQLAEMEGKKVQVNIAQVTEILSCLVKAMAKAPIQVAGCLLQCAAKHRLQERGR